jgi:hypothetical protein
MRQDSQLYENKPYRNVVIELNKEFNTIVFFLKYLFFF